jgi:hypothetical protein
MRMAAQPSALAIFRAHQTCRRPPRIKKPTSGKPEIGAQRGSFIFANGLICNQVSGHQKGSGKVSVAHGLPARHPPFDRGDKAVVSAMAILPIVTGVDAPAEAPAG